MSLTSKQRKVLRGMANTMEPTLIVGKENVSTGVVMMAEELLELGELVKCSVLETSELTAREAADQLVERTGSECVQVIGRKFVLYRRTHRTDVATIDVELGERIPPKAPAGGDGKRKVAKPKAEKVPRRFRATGEAKITRSSSGGRGARGAHAPGRKPGDRGRGGRGR